MVDDLMAGIPEVADEGLFELVGGVVRGDMDAHGPILPQRRGARPPPPAHRCAKRDGPRVRLGA
ncbi:hypothetical protein CHIBA101_1805 [Actinomyces sp. Chiba101]|nr:hypothetical protein CHIBA101_1805 [Actinomyces sp. Chiba101]